MAALSMACKDRELWISETVLTASRSHTACDTHHISWIHQAGYTNTQHGSLQTSQYLQIAVDAQRSTGAGKQNKLPALNST